MTHRPRVRGAILAGGGATRFGGAPKGLEHVGSRRVLDRLIDAFQEALGEPPVLIANAPEAPTWAHRLRVIRDVRPGTGSLGGLYTAVVAVPAPVVCVAWDMPFVPARLIETLASRLEGCDAVLPASTGRRGVEPLCAAYGPACADPMARRLEAGDLRAIAFHEDVRVCILSLDSIRPLGDPETMFFNINTPGDLTKAGALWRQLGYSR